MRDVRDRNPHGVGKLRYFKMMAVEDVVLDWVGGDVSCL
jgi:hypothetical protein